MATNINGDTGIDKIQPGTVEAADIPDGTITAAKLDTTYLTPTGDGSLLTGLPAGGGNYELIKYTAPATWTKPAGLQAIKVTVVGAGGTGAAATAPGGGAGGGAGGIAIYYASAPTIPGPVAVTAGSGTNSFGAFSSATAGSNASTVTGGNGGSGSSGTIDFTGGKGDNQYGPAGVGGPGGSNTFGFGGPGGTRGSPGSPGTAGVGFGGGGGGAGRPASETAPYGSGAVGSAGIIIIEEFY